MKRFTAPISYWLVITIFAAMVIVTTIFSLFGIDADWFRLTHGTNFYTVVGAAGMLGFFIPVIIPLLFWLHGLVTKNNVSQKLGTMTAFAAFVGWASSSLLKFFTGRPGLPRAPDMVDQVSKVFHIGLGEGGIFWGWPSSHTTVAFAVSVALAYFWKDKKILVITVLGYAAFIAVGATGFHWLSDVISGILLGFLAGKYVHDVLFKNP